jgi:hypothetical protein
MSYTCDPSVKLFDSAVDAQAFRDAFCKSHTVQKLGSYHILVGAGGKRLTNHQFLILSEGPAPETTGPEPDTPAHFCVFGANGPVCIFRGPRESISLVSGYEMASLFNQGDDA